MPEKKHKYTNGEMMTHEWAEPKIEILVLYFLSNV